MLREQKGGTSSAATPSSTQMFNFIELLNWCCRRNSMVFLATTKEVLRDIPAGDRSRYHTDVLKSGMSCWKCCRLWPNKTSSIFTINSFKSTWVVCISQMSGMFHSIFWDTMHQTFHIYSTCPLVLGVGRRMTQAIALYEWWRWWKTLKKSNDILPRVRLVLDRLSSTLRVLNERRTHLVVVLGRACWNA